ncbi:FeoA family protein [Candidatus Albibeggiatoa sp. nov. NOAA]|uniref:FeoA family protein n=1 Tax=Candidatus Albibeggiatoa sp. nov. NOAA TaxID=3162724 RepID=UPI00330026E0|nr:ferrous iron transport protein A [Thiotrichaceae bacterium]
MTKQPAVYPLTLSKPNTELEVVAINGGHNLIKRLLAMGITSGSKLTVIDHAHAEGLVVRCQDTRWALGKGMAHKILVAESIAVER